jgi:hypothetical protein
MRQKNRNLVFVGIAVAATLAVGVGMVAQTVAPMVTTFTRTTNRVAFDSEFVTVTKPRMPAAVSSVKCGSDVYQVSTGTDKGNCVTNKNSDGSVASITCSDGVNSASVSCNEKGIGACGGSTGSGACTIPK